MATGTTSSKKSAKKSAGGANVQSSLGQASEASLKGPSGKSPIARLQALLMARGLDAYLVPSADEHINEYLPEENQRRQWLSNFTGSAGDLLVLAPGASMRNSGGNTGKNTGENATKSTGESAWLFADSRYHEQADLQVDLTSIRVSKLGLDGHPRLLDKLTELSRLPREQQKEKQQKEKQQNEGKQKSPRQKFVIGFDPFTVSWQLVQEIEKQLQHQPVTLKPVPGNLVDIAWAGERPKPSLAPVYALPQQYAGQSTEDKIRRYQALLGELNIDLMPLTKLDQIAWLLNLRGQDIPYNPVFLSYVIVTQTKTVLFCDASRIEKNTLAELKPLVEIQPYNAYAEALAKISKNKTVLLDPKHTTYGTYHIVSEQGATVYALDNPVEQDKAIKNKTELRWMQEAHYKSGRGKIRAFYWLHQQLAAGKPVTEACFAETLEAFYVEEKNYKGLSFNTIAGAGANSSIVHYGTPDPNKKLARGQLFLVDSGVQYLGGTTDDTRTISVGKPTRQQIQRYTEVLKAHINCATQIFPKGTEGARLDGITRANLWKLQLDYGHGTGHGVGAFLNVHEGPQGIHKLAGKALQPGMIVSIEPGYYEPGWGGIRCENLYSVIAINKHWYGFKTLTYIPFDLPLIDLGALNKEQHQWLKQYHQDCIAVHEKHLGKSELAWLKKYAKLK